MNIEEAKRKLHNMAYRDLQTKPYELKLADIMQILNQIEFDQPKLEVSREVADWYEEHKDNLEYNLYLYQMTIYDEKVEKDDFYYWIQKSNSPIRTLINMHQFGYTVKKEKLYKVRDKRLHPDRNYLNFDKNSECWFFSNGVDTYSLIVKHTRKKLEESGFNVFDDYNYEVIEVTE